MAARTPTRGYQRQETDNAGGVGGGAGGGGGGGMGGAKTSFVDRRPAPPPRSGPQAPMTLPRTRFDASTDPRERQEIESLRRYGYVMGVCVCWVCVCWVCGCVGVGGCVGGRMAAVYEHKQTNKHTHTHTLCISLTQNIP